MTTIKAKSSRALRNWLKNASRVEQGQVVSSCTLKESLLKDFLKFILTLVSILGLALVTIVGLLHEDTRLIVIITYLGIFTTTIFIDLISIEGVDGVYSALSATKKIAGWRFNKTIMIVGVISLAVTAILFIVPQDVRNDLLKTGPFGASVVYSFSFLAYMFGMISLIVLYWVYKRTVGREKTVTVELVDGNQVTVTVPWYKYAAAKLHFCTFYDLSH